MDKSILERYENLKSLVTERKVQFDRVINFIENETSWLN